MARSRWRWRSARTSWRRGARRRGSRRCARCARCAASASSRPRGGTSPFSTSTACASMRHGSELQATTVSEVSENAAVVRAWQDAANLGRVEDLLVLSHPEFEMTESSVLPGAAHVKGLEALRSYYHGWRRNWSEWEWRE